jgi:hypothetical protein
MGKLINLNNLKIRHDNSYFQDLEDHSNSWQDKPVEVLFRNLEDRLVRLIKCYPMVVGCAAWLTSEPILQALSTRSIVSILVQKEDFLRPDLDNGPHSKEKLRAMYASLPTSQRLFHQAEVARLSYGGDPDLAAVRCVGICPKFKRVMPRMHHKFLVFCDIVTKDGCVVHFRNCTVWTGSFNLTKNATNSFENAVVIRDEEVANSYYGEWAQLLALSEPLNWETEYVEPEWRIGS